MDGVGGFVELESPHEEEGGKLFSLDDAAWLRVLTAASSLSLSSLHDDGGSDVEDCWIVAMGRVSGRFCSVSAPAPGD